MAAKKIITVFGATGAQGGGLVRAILNDPEGEFAVRAITRDPSSEKAKALASSGAEVVVADIDDPAGLDNALKGSYGAYFVTFFWSHFSAEKETAEGRAMAEAARAAGIEHAIWSTLEDVRNFVSLDDDHLPTLQGKYKVPHFDGKGEADHFFTDNNVPVTFLLPSFYWENLIYFGMGPKRAEDGILTFTVPMGNKKLSGIAAEDIGKCALGIFKKGASTIGKRIGIAGDEPTCQQMADALTNAIGEEVRYNAISPAAFRSFGFPGAEDLGNMFQFYSEFEAECTSIRNVDFSRELNPSLQTFDQWLGENIRRIPLQ
jgi:uncharacterized protein YbjT (DUF2867 family)